MPPERQRQTTSPPTDSSARKRSLASSTLFDSYWQQSTETPSMSRAYSMGRRTESNSTTCGTPSTGPRTNLQCGSGRKVAADSGTPAIRPRHGSRHRQVRQRHRQQGPRASNRQEPRHRHILSRQSSRQRWSRPTWFFNDFHGFRLRKLSKSWKIDEIIEKPKKSIKTRKFMDFF